jgi:hypothetical protein
MLSNYFIRQCFRHCHCLLCSLRQRHPHSHRFVLHSFLRRGKKPSRCLLRSLPCHPPWYYPS